MTNIFKLNSVLGIFKNRNHPEYQYLNILKKLIDKGTFHDDRTGTGTLRSWGEKMEFDLSDGSVPMLTTKKMYPRIIIEELIWFLSGSTDVKKLQEKNVKIWNGNGSKEECDKFNRIEGDLGPIYGHQWRNFSASKRKSPLDEDYWSKSNNRWVNKAYEDDGYDQIKYVIESIINTPNSRRIIFNGWNATEAHEVNPPPCHTLYQFQVEDGKLNASLLQRSGDHFLGVGFNILSLSIMVHLFAKLCNLKPGRIVHVINDCHLYTDHIDSAKEQVKRTPFPFPRIEINSRLDGLGMDGIKELKIDDIKIVDYKSHGKLYGKMSV